MPDEQILLREIFKELVQINTTDPRGNTTIAAKAMAKRLKDSGYTDQIEMIIYKNQTLPRLYQDNYLN